MAPHPAQSTKALIHVQDGIESYGVQHELLKLGGFDGTPPLATGVID